MKLLKYIAQNRIEAFNDVEFNIIKLKTLNDINRIIEEILFNYRKNKVDKEVGKIINKIKNNRKNPFNRSGLGDEQGEGGDLFQKIPINKFKKNKNQNNQNNQNTKKIEN